MCLPQQQTTNDPEIVYKRLQAVRQSLGGAPDCRKPELLCSARGRDLLLAVEVDGGTTIFGGR